MLIEDALTILADEALAELGAPFSTEFVFKRPLRETDPDGSLGLITLEWVPGDSVIGQWDPAVATYLVQVQAFIKHTDEEEGLSVHTEQARRIRAMLYRGQSLRVRLAAVTETHLHGTERVLKWWVSRQRFAANEIDGQFLYLSTTDLLIQTETV